jgi:hypothetical protein
MKAPRDRGEPTVHADDDDREDREQRRRAPAHPSGRFSHGRGVDHRREPDRPGAEDERERTRGDTRLEQPHGDPLDVGHRRERDDDDRRGQGDREQGRRATPAGIPLAEPGPRK